MRSGKPLRVRQLDRHPGFSSPHPPLQLRGLLLPKCFRVFSSTRGLPLVKQLPRRARRDQFLASPSLGADKRGDRPRYADATCERMNGGWDRREKYLEEGGGAINGDETVSTQTAQL